MRNQRNPSLIAVIGCLLSWQAVAGDFACLKALIPATTHHWVKSHRNSFAIPIVSPTGDAIAISQWDHDHLTNIYVYTEASSKRFDRMTAIGATETQELRGLGVDWIKEHLLATKLESFEVFKLQVEPPGGWEHKVTAFHRATASLGDVGGWLVEGEKPGDLDRAIHEEIEVRETWVRNNNLDTDRFKAWSKAEKLCRHK